MHCEATVAFFRDEDDDPWSLDCELAPGHDGPHQMHAPEWRWDGTSGMIHAGPVEIIWRKQEA